MTGIYPRLNYINTSITWSAAAATMTGIYPRLNYINTSITWSVLLLWQITVRCHYVLHKCLIFFCGNLFFTRHDPPTYQIWSVHPLQIWRVPKFLKMSHMTLTTCTQGLVSSSFASMLVLATIHLCTKLKCLASPIP